MKNVGPQLYDEKGKLVINVLGLLSKIRNREDYNLIRMNNI